MKNKKIIDIVVGTRPNFIKAISLINAFNFNKKAKFSFVFRLIHTGQHYDKRLSDVFFIQLNIPSPYVNLNVKSGSHSEQMASVMIGYENFLRNSPCNLCVVLGDVNSTAACAISAKKLNIPVAHVEAGIRSYDTSMPEEINRIITDSVSDYFFTTSELATANLLKIGAKKDRIFFVGNTMIDTLKTNLANLREPFFWDKLEKKKYFLLTLHRPSNVDDVVVFKSILKCISSCAKDFTVVFPVHPRTKNFFNSFIKPKNFLLVDPQPYLEFNFLVKNSAAVITDSGGISEETTFLKVPCLTIRNNTERPETVSIGTNVLVGTETKNFKQYFDLVFLGKWKKGRIPKKWDGKTGCRIVDIFLRIQNLL